MIQIICIIIDRYIKNEIAFLEYHIRLVTWFPSSHRVPVSWPGTSLGLDPLQCCHAICAYMTSPQERSCCQGQNFWLIRKETPNTNTMEKSSGHRTTLMNDNLRKCYSIQTTANLISLSRSMFNIEKGMLASLQWCTTANQIIQGRPNCTVQVMADEPYHA